MRYLTGGDSMHLHGVTKVEVQAKRWAKSDLAVLSVCITKEDGYKVIIDCFGVRKDDRQQRVPELEVVEDWEEDSKTL